MIPKICDNCKSRNIAFCSNDVIYGELVGDWPYCYYCYSCKALTACHPNTNYPMGLMATKPIRRRRAKLHSLFDPIWKLGLISRDDAYKWLAGQLLVGTDCHIGMLTKEQLDQAINLMLAHQILDYKFFRRRKVKNEQRRIQHADRQHERSNRGPRKR